MIDNQLFTTVNPIYRALRPAVYGLATITLYQVQYCEGECIDTDSQLDEILLAHTGMMSWQYYEYVHTTGVPNLRTEQDMNDYLDWVSMTRLARHCKGHAHRSESIKGMLRSFSFEPTGGDASACSGRLSITIMPWDQAQEHLGHKRVLRAKVDHHGYGRDGYMMFDDHDRPVMNLLLNPWSPNMW